MARRRCAELAAALLLAPTPALATDLGARLEAEAWWGLRTSDRQVSLARFSLLPSIRPRLSDSLTADIRVRADFAPDRTGLGTRETYAPWSRPLLLADGAQAELERATLQWRSGSMRLTVGKQSFAWGALDGVPVTDRFDPVRRRDFVATETRPERIGRWSVRLQSDIGGLGLDAGFVPDPTVAQQARPGDAFSIKAPRLRAGLPAGGPDVPQLLDRRDRALADASWGLRASHAIGRLDVALVAMRGPEADPLLLPGQTHDGRPALRLAFPHRTAFGGSLILPAGSTVWRLEVAHVPDQPLNRDASRAGRLEVTRAPRTVAGVGMDWQAPGALFVNAQLVVDHVTDAGRQLARPETDLIATLRLHRDFAQTTVRLRGEVIANLAKGDAYIRPAVEWKVDDRVTLSGGSDLFAGPKDGLLGQFGSESRLWLKARTAF